jgi:hypothetical protein
MVVEDFEPKRPGCVLVCVAHVDVEVLASDQKDSSEQKGLTESLEALHDGAWHVFVLTSPFDKAFVIAEFEENTQSTVLRVKSVAQKLDHAGH